MGFFGVKKVTFFASGQIWFDLRKFYGGKFFKTHFSGPPKVGFSGFGPKKPHLPPWKLFRTFRNLANFGGVRKSGSELNTGVNRVLGLFSTQIWSKKKKWKFFSKKVVEFVKIWAFSGTPKFGPKPLQSKGTIPQNLEKPQISTISTKFPGNSGSDLAKTFGRSPGLVATLCSRIAPIAIWLRACGAL